ncbi:MAG: TonB-dependent receptor [Bryobacteraceae bacterium]
MIRLSASIRFTTFFSVFVFALFFSTPLQSQTTFGSLTGAVTDATGAAAPGVAVTLTNLATGEQRQTVTGDDGLFQFVNLLPGNYKIDATKAGFQHFTRTPIAVEVGQSPRINFALAVGEVTQTVEVTSETPLLQPETSSLGQVVDRRLTTELPLNGRNVFNLMTLAPSVVPQGQSMTNPTGTNPFAWNNYQIGGAFAGQSVQYLDGVPLNNGYLNLPSLIPTQDSIQEFKVQTNNLSPEWGRFAGGVVNLDTKSGGNGFHGEAYEFLRNKVLNANTFFNNGAGVSTPAFTQNQFGVNAGGPIVPNKTFWFFSYEGFRLRQGQSFVDTVPTLAERSGNFQGLLDASGNPVTIYDPNSTRQTGVDASGNPVYARTPIACNGQANVICPNLINSTSQALLKIWPLPNAAGQPGTNVNNYVTNYSAGGDNDQYIGRLDQVIGNKQRLFGRISYWSNLNLPTDPFGTGLCLDRCTETFDTYNGVIDDVVTFTPTIVGDFRASVNRFVYSRTNPNQGFDLTSIGWPASLNAQIPASVRSIPVPNVSGMAGDVAGTQGAGSVIGAYDTDYNFAPSLSWIHGKHSLKFGAQVLAERHNYAQTNIASGIFSFDNGFTASSPFSGSGGFGFASYLLGYPSGGNNSLPNFVASQNIYRGFYVSDTWHVFDKLTLNLGLRYEINGPWSERYDRLSWLDLGVQNPLSQATGLDLKGNMELVNSPSRHSRNNLDTNYHEFAPRIGAAYQVTDKVVVRAGYGIFWLPYIFIWDLAPNNDPLNSISTNYVASTNGGLTPTGSFSNPFPNGILQPPGRNPNFQQTFYGQGINAPIPNHPLGYMQQYNFDVQFQAAGGFLVDVAYAGSKGTHLGQGSQLIDQLPDQYLSMGTGLVAQVPNPFLGLITNGSLAAATISRGQLLTAYPQYGGVYDRGAPWGSSSYNSLQLKVEKRIGSGTFLAAYTWSKFISNMDAVTSWLEGDTGGIAGVQDWNNLRLERSISSDDIPQRLVVSYALDLPFGKGKKYLANVHGVADKVVSGWGVDGTTVFQSGFPLKFGTSVNLTNSFGGGSRPNVGCADTSISGSATARLDQWFQTSCFSQPAAFTFGNEGRVDPRLRQQGTHNFDFALFKNMALAREGQIRLQFRAEFFNLFNSPQFGPPGSTVGTAQFGVVSSQVNNPRLVQFALRFMF